MGVKMPQQTQYFVQSRTKREAQLQNKGERRWCTAKWKNFEGQQERRSRIQSLPNFPFESVMEIFSGGASPKHVCFQVS